MKLSEIKEVLVGLSEVTFTLPDGSLVPAHFHVTEVGMISKKFIDCGGTIRNEESINFQLWQANDYDHRLTAEKLLSIIELSEKKLSLPDLEISVEYQGKTLESYGLAFKNNTFLMLIKNTDCLAPDKCNIDTKGKQRLQVSCCEPSSGCC